MSKTPCNLNHRAVFTPQPHTQAADAQVRAALEAAPSPLRDALQQGGMQLGGPGSAPEGHCSRSGKPGAAGQLMQLVRLVSRA